MANDIIVFCARVAQDRETCSVSYSPIRIAVQPYCPMVQKKHPSKNPYCRQDAACSFFGGFSRCLAGPIWKV